MIFTVSTVKDGLPAVEKFVRRNLANGADHLVVFLDDPAAPGQREVLAFLDAHEHVTAIATDDSWWKGDRPEQLNVRQRINANLTRSALTQVDDVDWVFHIDGDEVVCIPPDLIAKVPRKRAAVLLQPWEAVARKSWPGGEVTHFKKLLPREQLVLLRTLKVIRRAQNGFYFHGHEEGKSGVRPGFDTWLGLHRAVDAQEQDVPVFRRPGLGVWHFESYDGEEFVRKWQAILSAGPLTRFRPRRLGIATAIQAVQDLDVGPEVQREILMRVFENTIEDDYETLLTLGVLSDHTPDAGTYQPRALTAQQHDQFVDVLAHLRGRRKRPFHPGHPAEAARKVMPGARRSFLGRG